MTRSRRDRIAAAALAATIGVSPAPADPIASPPATADEISANTERTYAAIAKLPRGNLLLPYQQTALATIEQYALTVIEKSRRIGLTWGLAAHAALKAATSKEAGGDDVLYISYSQEMTREFIEACAMWARAYMGVTGETREFLFDDQIEGSTETRQIKAFRIKFASGFEIVALSSAPRSLRGKQGMVVLDEAAFVDSLDELLKAALALQIWGSKIIVVSTHNGVDNPFNVLLEEIRSKQRRGQIITITFAQAMADGLYERVCLVRGKTPSPEDRIAWEAEIRGNYGDAAAEELDCIPASGKGSWISAELIAACESATAGKPEHYTGKKSVLGWDIARNAHFSVMAPFELVGAKLVLRDRVEMTETTFKEQYATLDRLTKTFKVGTMRLDQTGLGIPVTEHVQGLYGVAAVEGIMFTPANKLMLATLLKERFERGLIEVPADHHVRADLRSIKRSGKGTGAPVFEAGDTKEGHADRFWAYALACLAAEAGVGAIEFHAIARDAGSAFMGSQRAVRTDEGFGIVAGELSDMTGY